MGPNISSYFVLERAAEYLNAAEVDGALESLPEALVLALLPADLAEAATAEDDHQQRQQSDSDRCPDRNCSSNTRYTSHIYIYIHCVSKKTAPIGQVGINSSKQVLP